MLGLWSWGGAATPARAAEQDVEPTEDAAEDLDPNRWEPAAIPAINYSSDIGFGFGAVGSLARFEEGFNPYRARVQLLVLMAAKEDATGTIGIPFHDHAIELDLPGLWDDLLRLNLRLAFGRYTNAPYYGLGNASEARSFSDAELEASEVARRYHTYEMTNPNLQLNGRFKLFEQPTRVGKRRLEALVGVSTAYRWIGVYEGSKLAQDVALSRADTADGRTMSELLHGTEDNYFLAFNLGLLWDTRDHEFAPSRGNFTELSVQISPGADAGLTYAGFFLGTRWFAPIVGEHLVVGSRGCFPMGGDLGRTVAFWPARLRRCRSGVDRLAGPRGGGRGPGRPLLAVQSWGRRWWPHAVGRDLHPACRFRLLTDGRHDGLLHRHRPCLLIRTEIVVGWSTWWRLSSAIGRPSCFAAIEPIPATPRIADVEVCP